MANRLEDIEKLVLEEELWGAVDELDEEATTL